MRISIDTRFMIIIHVPDCTGSTLMVAKSVKNTIIYLKVRAAGDFFCRYPFKDAFLPLETRFCKLEFQKFRLWRRWYLININ